MSDPTHIKDQVKKLLESDQRYQALRLIQNTYSVTESEAEKLLATLADDEPAKPTQSQATTNGCGGCFSSLFKVGSILVGLLGLLFLAATVFFYYFYEDFKKDAVPVRGIVAETVQAEPVTPTDTIQKVFLVFKYEVADSVYTYQTITTYPATEYLVQDSVNLLINSNDPTYASLEADEVMEDFYLIFGIAAGVCFFVAFVLWFVSRIPTKNPGVR
ncbi:MAG: hypothetical protein UZ12_BCD005001711 [Bacteroidetes bacterium OLB12]|nr:MAG: hypothetical protein UZ12_BCD005001711 [Bacteroidetes bacterium OLB12]HNR73389.1 hypothetical protein [Cyclobacteriaceae bacterium]